MTISASNIHKEKVLQDHLIAELANGEGYERRDPMADYDRALAMDRALVLRFVQSSQPEAWEKLTQHYSRQSS